MITNLLLNVVVLFIGAIFSWLPQVTTLPTIMGVDVDGALVTGVGQLYQFTDTFWPLGYMFNGFIFLMGYYIIKLGIRFLLGHRGPAH